MTSPTSPINFIATILFDTSHNEMLDINEPNFSEFLDLLHTLGLKIKKNENMDLTIEVLQNTDILIIGNPIENYFSSIEIKNITDFVRKGGRLVLISEYGSDYLQKTNINDISERHFGILFQKNIVRENNNFNQNCSSILSIQDFREHKIANQLREVIIGGSCSLILNNKSEALLISEGSWTESLNSNEQWFKNGEEQKHIITAFTEYGRGKVIAMGDIDIFTNDPNMGLNILDNRKLIRNILNWLIEPVEENDAMIWALDQMGAFLQEIKDMNNKIDNIIETMTILEQRITVIEEKKDDEKNEKTLVEEELTKL